MGRNYPTNRRALPIFRAARAALRTSAFHEPLESRVHLTVSQDANGYTVVTPDPTSKVIYVSSSSGSDANNGLSTSAPVQTLIKAESMLRNGFSDQMLLKAGDTFYDPLGGWTVSGPDAAHPAVMGSYGSGARPVVATGGSYYGFFLSTGRGAVSSVNNVDILGIEFYCNNRDPASPTFNSAQTGGAYGIELRVAASNILVEDCKTSFYKDDFDVEGDSGPVSNVTLRRDVVVDSWSQYGVDMHSEGLYLNATDHTTITECLFDHDGWNASIPSGSAEGFNHDIYAYASNTNFTATNNVIAEASFVGILARCGGIIDGNTFVNNPYDLSFGDANGSNSTSGGVYGEVKNNVVVGGAALNPSILGGQAIEVGNTAPGAGVTVSGNIITGDTQHANPGILLTMATQTDNPSQAVGENDLTLSNNIINGWYQGIYVDGRFAGPGVTGLYAFNNVTFSNNDIVNSTTAEIKHDSAYSPTQETWSGNRYYDTSLSSNKWVSLQNNQIPFATWQATAEPTATILSALPYADPNRTVATYDTALGGNGTVADFLSQVRLTSRSNYQAQYQSGAVNAYISAGFGTVDTSQPPTAAATTVNVNSASSGSSTTTFTVTYSDSFALNTATLGSTNVLITGPNGYSSYATFVSAAPSATAAGGFQTTVVTYKMTAPGGSWSSTGDGVYTLSVLPNQVKDKTGLAVAAGVVGSLTADLTPPVAVATAPAVSAAGGTAYTFTVTYSDVNGVDVTTLGNGQVKVTGPNNFSQLAAYSGETAGTAPNSVVATYQITAPGGSWSAAAAGTYTVSLLSGQVADTFGNYDPASTMTTFQAAIGISASVPGGTGTIAGKVFNDANANSVLDSREVGMVGVVVFADLDGTGTLTADDPMATTDASGNYVLSGLPAGNVTVIQQVPAGYTAKNLTVSLVTGQTLSAQNIADSLTTTVVNGSNKSAVSTTNTSTGSRTNISAGSTVHTTSGAVNHSPPARRGFTGGVLSSN